MNKRYILRGLVVLLVVVLIFVATPFSLLANSFNAPTYIRVGLESHFLEQDQITIHSNTLAVGVFSAGRFDVSGFLSSSNNFIAQPDGGTYVRLAYNFNNLTQAQQTAAGYPSAIPALTDVGVWVLYLPAPNMETAQQTAAALPGAAAVAPSSRRVRLSAGGVPVTIGDVNLQLQDMGGITSLGVRSYRGFIELGRFANNRITAVNIVNIEDYLLSVVPSEMPASWHIEALKAQAVAARTFTVFRLGRMASRGYDLCDTTFSQVYSGVANEHENTTRAVNETRGMLIFHNGLPIEAVYSSSSGGVTENSENAWGTALPYLRSVQEINEPGAREWTRTVTLSQINQFLAAQNVNIGGATAIRLDKSPQGRVQELTIIGATGNHIVRLESIRSFFTPSLDSRNFTIIGGTTTTTTQMPTQNHSLALQQAFVRNSVGAVTSTNLPGLHVIGVAGNSVIGNSVSVAGAGGTANLGGTVQGGQTAATVTSIGYSIELSGRGWGHGVGMSQHGAHGMAQMGFDFRQILMHYYTGVVIN